MSTVLGAPLQILDEHKYIVFCEQIPFVKNSHSIYMILHTFVENLVSANFLEVYRLVLIVHLQSQFKSIHYIDLALLEQCQLELSH